MPARVGRRTIRRATQRVHRDLDRPARVPALAEAHQGETGPAEFGTFTAGKRLRFNAIAKRHRNSWSAFARITLKLSCEGRNGKISSDSVAIPMGATPLSK